MVRHFHLICAILAIAAIALQSVATVDDDDDRCLVENIQVQNNFDLDRYLGKWYEMKWIPENWFPPEYNYKDFVINYQRYNSTAATGDWAGRESNEEATCLTGRRVFITTDTPGKLKLIRTYPDNVVQTSDYWIVLTDYDHYALVWGCREIQNGRCADGKEDSWVWSRSKTLEPNYMQLIDNKITEVCLNHTAFFITDHNQECFQDV